jgi:pimeloyl-ACP methyl ester carboxylesterase
VVIIHGRHDRLAPYGNALYLSQRLSRASWVEIVGVDRAGHHLPWDVPVYVRVALARHLLDG